MTELDLELPGLATELIEEFGKSITYTPQAEGDYDPATSRSTPAGDPLTIKAIVEPYTGQRMLAGLVEIGDLKVTAAAESFPNGPPTPQDICGIDGRDYTILAVLPTYSGDLVALYEFQVRT